MKPGNRSPDTVPKPSRSSGNDKKDSMPLTLREGVFSYDGDTQDSDTNGDVPGLRPFRGPGGPLTARPARPRTVAS